MEFLQQRGIGKEAAWIANMRKDERRITQPIIWGRDKSRGIQDSLGILVDKPAIGDQRARVAVGVHDPGTWRQRPTKCRSRGGSSGVHVMHKHRGSLRVPSADAGHSPSSNDAV